jgi:prevent-host-death family protein
VDGVKLANLSEVRKNLASIIDMAQHEPVVVTRRGKPIAVIVGVEGLDPEQVALRCEGAFQVEIEQATGVVRPL